MRLLIYLFLFPALVAGATTTAPEAVGMSSERLERIAPMIAEHVDRKEIAGAVTIVARRGSVVHYEAHGRRDLNSPEPMAIDSIFGLTSMTKPIASVAAMVLVEEGRMLLDSRLEEYLPEFADRKVRLTSGEEVPAKQPILVHHLLAHTSGLPTTERNRYSYPTLAEHIRDVARLPLHFHPGEQWKYPESYEVLGRLIEVISGSDLKTFLEDSIFVPLGMDDTHFGVPSDKRHRQAIPVVQGKSDPTYRGRFPRGDLPNNYFSARGGLFSTGIDYWKFCQMMLNGGHLARQQVVSRKSVERMIATSANAKALPGWNYTAFQFGLGFEVVTDQAEGQTYRSNGSYSWSGAYGTMFWIDPKEELIGIFMTQASRVARTRVRDQFENLVYAAIKD